MKFTQAVFRTHKEYAKSARQFAFFLWESEPNIED
jgi:hypothetical protein